MVNSGLEDVVAATTRLSDVDGERGELVIAGYPVGELAAHASFEETTWLLWHSALPMLANRPAAPLGAGAVIQVVDPQRVCLDVGIGRSVDQPTGSEAKP